MKDGDDPSGGPKTTRRWQELLQELRVAQTGVQILTGFLLTVPFSQRFTHLEPHQKAAYVVLLVASVVTTSLLVAPVAFHRLMFRHRQRPWLVEAAHRCALGGLIMMAATSCGVVYLVTDVVLVRWAALLITAVMVALFAGLWVTVPLIGRLERDDGDA